MSSHEALIKTALALPGPVRAELASLLLESLDRFDSSEDPDGDEWNAAWEEELERRLDRIDAGEATTHSLQDALQRWMPRIR